MFFVEDDDGGLWLIDAGIESGAERIGGGLRALGRAPQELRGIVVTHLHGDHVGGWPRSGAHRRRGLGAPRMLRLCERVCAAGRSSPAPACCGR